VAHPCGPADARALIRFLVDAFGFEETVVYGDGDVVHHAQLSWPSGGWRHARLGPGRPGGRQLAGAARAPFGAYVVTDDPDGVYARATAAGAEIIDRPARDRLRFPATSRRARPRKANRWSFGTYRGEPPKIRLTPARPAQPRPTPGPGPPALGPPGGFGSGLSATGLRVSGNLGYLSRIGHDDRDVRPYCRGERVFRALVERRSKPRNRARPRREAGL